MRNLPLLLTLLLLSVLLGAASAHASPLVLTQSSPLVAIDEEEAEGDQGEGEGEEEEVEEGCVVEDEEDVQLCAEIAEEEKQSREAERCVLERASASVETSRSGRVHLAVRYSTYEPAPFSLRYSLRGSKGTLSLGSAKAKFGRTGTFHDVVRVEDGKLAKVLAAREFQIELQAQKTPGSCRERLTVQRRGAGRPHRP